MELENKVAIVTGAASGIGRASALLYARNGAMVVLADRDAEGSETARQEITGSSGAAIAAPVEISDSADCQRLVDRVVAEYGRIDILLHCAGICPRQSFLDMSDDEWRRVLSINLDGSFYITRSVGRSMVARRSGTMILLTSDRGLNGGIDCAHYAASKGGMIALVKSAALALGPSGITVNGINPGMTDTPLARGGVSESNWRDKQRVDVLGTSSRSEEIAEIALFLAGKAAAFMTGQIVATRMRAFA